MRGNRMNRGMRGEISGNRMRGMRGMTVEWEGNVENLWETGIRGGMTVEWENSSYKKKKTQIYNSYHKLILLSSYEKKKTYFKLLKF